MVVPRTMRKMWGPSDTDFGEKYKLKSREHAGQIRRREPRGIAGSLKAEFSV